jgi:hypothetical protein
MYDLPSEEIGDPGMPDQYNVRPLILLHETFRPPAAPANEVFSAIELNLYYDEGQPRWCVQPDWFGVIGAPQSILSKIGGSRKMPGRKIALNLRGLIFLPHIFLLKPGPVRDTPPRIFETIPADSLPLEICDLGGTGSATDRGGDVFAETGGGATGIA